MFQKSDMKCEFLVKKSNFSLFSNDFSTGKCKNIKKHKNHFYNKIVVQILHNQRAIHSRVFVQQVKLVNDVVKRLEKFNIFFK